MRVSSHTTTYTHTKQTLTKGKAALRVSSYTTTYTHTKQRLIVCVYANVRTCVCVCVCACRVLPSPTSPRAQLCPGPPVNPKLGTGVKTGTIQTRRRQPKP